MYDKTRLEEELSNKAVLIRIAFIYLVAGFTANQPPTLFTFLKRGINELAGDNLVSRLKDTQVPVA